MSDLSPVPDLPPVVATYLATPKDQRVEGDFPGSPVELHHHFSLAGDRITALTICT